MGVRAGATFAKRVHIHQRTRTCKSGGCAMKAVGKERAAKARNHSRVAEALKHSEDTAYKPPCGEIAMCPRMKRMERSK